MNSYIDHITGFLFDEHRRLSSKAAVVLFAVIAVFLIDNFLGFSYFYSTEKKVEQVQKLNLIITDTTSDSTTRAFALQLRSEMLDRENLLNQSLSFLRNVKWTNSKTDQTNVTKETAKTKESIIKNSFWFHISAGGFYYFIAVLMLPVMVITDKKTSLPQRIATGILSVALFCGFGWLFYWLCNFIPQVSTTTWFWNYLINLAIQILLIGLLVATIQKKK